MTTDNETPARGEDPEPVAGGRQVHTPATSKGKGGRRRKTEPETTTENGPTE